MAQGTSRGPANIAQNIAETCQKYFQSFIAIEILSQYFCQIFKNISLQHITILKFWNIFVKKLIFNAFRNIVYNFV